jgi:hypothetical protein
MNQMFIDMHHKLMLSENKGECCGGKNCGPEDEKKMETVKPPTSQMGMHSSNN